MNKLIISGNLGQEPEPKYFESGKNVTRLSIATRNYKGETDWVSAEIWGKSGEAAANHLRKGSSVIVEGQGGIEVWLSNKTGEAKGRLVVKNAQWEFAGSKPKGDDSCSDGEEF